MSKAKEIIMIVSNKWPGCKKPMMISSKGTGNTKVIALITVDLSQKIHLREVIFSY
jgi:hypothetical protein